MIRGQKQAAFTIVELLIVVVVIAILAAITIVAYNGITRQAKEATLASSLEQATKKLKAYQVQNGTYPASLATVWPGADLEYAYSNVDGTFCLEGAVEAKHFFVTESGSVQQGECPGVPIVDGVAMQLITNANCPSVRTRAVDARDNHTYWVQKLADGKCWMLTNLGYAGGGTNTYGDVRTLVNGTGTSAIYTSPRYYVVPSTTNYTTEPTAPSTATNGAGQYGYLYNWCGAMGGQATSACLNATTPTPIITTTVCPASWRLPTGTPTSGEIAALNTAVNGGSTANSNGLRSNWLGQYSGRGTNSFVNQGVYGYYWSSTQDLGTNARYLLFSSSAVYAPDTADKTNGYAVRCVAV